MMLYNLDLYFVALFFLKTNIVKYQYNLTRESNAGFRLPKFILLLHPSNWNMHFHLDWQSLFDQRPWNSRQDGRNDKCKWIISLELGYKNITNSQVKTFNCLRHVWRKNMDLKQGLTDNFLLTRNWFASLRGIKCLISFVADMATCISQGREWTWFILGNTWRKVRVSEGKRGKRTHWRSTFICLEHQWRYTDNV